jgi:hypothetical protein
VLHRPSGGRADAACPECGLWGSHRRKAEDGDSFTLFSSVAILVLVETSIAMRYIKKHSKMSQIIQPPQAELRGFEWMKSVVRSATARRTDARK